MKKWLFAALLACALAGVLWHAFFRGGTSASPGAGQAEALGTALVRAPARSAAHSPGADAALPPAERTASSGVAIVNPAPHDLPPPTPFLLGSADTPPAMEPATVLSNMRIAIRQYGSRFGGNPVGTNEEITRALNGDNPKQVKFISEESGLRINVRGELVDYWGTPFFFHQLSGTEMEIHSAGPDRLMWTADDLVTK